MCININRKRLKLCARTGGVVGIINWQVNLGEISNAIGIWQVLADKFCCSLLLFSAIDGDLLMFWASLLTSDALF